MPAAWSAASGSSHSGPSPQHQPSSGHLRGGGQGSSPCVLFAAADAQAAWVFIELGAAVLGLAVLTRLAHRLGFSAIPLYLLGGLAFGNGGLLPLHFTEEFVHVGAEIGVILLLFMLGLEYTGEQLRDNLRSGLAAGVADFLLNFPPGLRRRPAAGLGAARRRAPGRRDVHLLVGHRRPRPGGTPTPGQPRDAHGPVDPGAGRPGDGGLPAAGGRAAHRPGVRRRG